MRKFIIRTFLIIFSGCAFYFCMVWFAVTLGLSHWLPNFHSTSGGYGQLLLRIREVQQVQNVDILFMGSSHTYRGFDPREFEEHGITSFNLGSSSQTPFNSYYLLKDYLPNTNPKVLVLDLYWNMLVQDGLESTIDIVSNAKLKGGVLDMVKNSKNTLAFNSMLINSIQRLHTPLHKLEQQEFPHDMYIPGGYTQTLLTENMLSEEQLNKLAPMEVEFSDVQMSHLNKIIRMCKERGIQLVFVVTPVTEYYRNKVVNYTEYKTAISALAAKHNIPFIDYNGREDLQLHNLKEFYDEDHLTQPAVKKFNQLFIKDLKSRGILEPTYPQQKYYSMGGDQSMSHALQ